VWHSICLLSGGMSLKLIMWVAIAGKVFKVRGEGQGRRCTNVNAVMLEAYISTVWHWGSLVIEVVVTELLVDVC